jgi:hypothetical protein
MTVATEWRLERLLQYQEGRMAVIKKVDGYRHDIGLVLRRHPTAEQLLGSNGFVVSLQAGDLITDPSLRKSGKDTALAEIGFRGHQKFTQALSSRDLDIWGGRMLKDIFKAFYSGDLGMGCQADTSWITAAKAIVDTGFASWITCEATVVVKYPLTWVDP